MPVVVARLGSQEITEPSEELRLTLVSFLSSLVDLCGAKIAPYLNDMICILQRTIVDPYPEVKKVSEPRKRGRRGEERAGGVSGALCLHVR